MDASLILYAEHEFNASTFAARVTTSTLADFHATVTSAIGTLRGPLHGGANEEAMRLISRYATPEEAETAVRAMLTAGEKIMGFGHRVYKKQLDPRSPIIQQWAQRLAEASGDTTLYRRQPCHPVCPVLLFFNKKVTFRFSGRSFFPH
jgi:2-methylcitrate synthase